MWTVAEDDVVRGDDHEAIKALIAERGESMPHNTAAGRALTWLPAAGTRAVRERCDYLRSLMLMGDEQEPP